MSDRSESLRQSQRKYQHGLKTYIIRLRPEKDGDVIARLEQVVNKTEYVRKLIRRDIRGE